MASKGQLTGMRGVYLGAAELSRQGFIASPTSRSAAGADLLVTDQKCRNSFSVQVKTNAKPAGFWLTGQKAKTIASDSHIYVFVNLRDSGSHEFYIVPSEIVGRKTRREVSPKSEWFAFYKRDAKGHKDKWDTFGKP